MPSLPVAFASLFFFATLVSIARAADAPAPGTTFTQAHRAIGASAPTAAAAFDRGFTLLDAFNPEGARRAFEDATKLEPGLAMAWWGIAMSHGININLAYDPAQQRLGRDAIRRAKSLEQQAAPADRALIDAAAQRFGYVGGPDADRSARAYRDAMNVAATAFPFDDDIGVLAAEAEMDVHPWSYFERDGSPTPGTLGAIARLNAVLARTPQHIEANHLLVHAWEESQHPENALAAARRLQAMNFEDGAEHLAHMPAHTFIRVGEYHEAGEANARAIALYTRYLAGDPAGHDSYFDHDCAFGVDAFMMAGELGRSQALAGTCAARGYDLSAQIDLRFRRWDALAERKDANDFVSGMVATHAARLGDAAKHLGELRKVSGTVASIEADVLAASLQAAKSEQSGEISALQHAVATQDDAGYAEPPNFFYPVRETLGGAYFRAGRYVEAERTFREELLHDADNPRALYALAETLEHEGKTTEANDVRRRFAQMWAKADSPLDMNEY